MATVDVTVDQKAMQMVISAARHGPQSKALTRAIDDCERAFNAACLLAELHEGENDE